MTRLPRDDSVLLEETAAGDRRAWEELHDRYSLPFLPRGVCLRGGPRRGGTGRGRNLPPGIGAQRISLVYQGTSMYQPALWGSREVRRWPTVDPAQGGSEVFEAPGHGSVVLPSRPPSAERTGRKACRSVGVDGVKYRPSMPVREHETRGPHRAPGLKRVRRSCRRSGRAGSCR